MAWKEGDDVLLAREPDLGRRAEFSRERRPEPRRLMEEAETGERARPVVMEAESIVAAVELLSSVADDWDCRC